MKTEHLEGRITDYKKSIETVIEKKILWKTKIKSFLVKTLQNIVDKHAIGWRVQELNWIGTNEAVNITFESFPVELAEKINQMPNYQFIQGGALVFSESYNGNVRITILFPLIENISIEDSSLELGVFSPAEITEKLIVEMVDEFLKEIIKWELPAPKAKLGY
ncbi:hypothetical protein V8G56_10040 [Gaetbulibacter aquiaggeris]|uniref:Uncharacterized protein n=1 Tax=Gaetbulibacter aquiaggeris TaxID=1735373 RepID=A0ABW7MQG9_9FLAO